MSTLHSPVPAGHMPVTNYSSDLLLDKDIVYASPVIVREIRLTNAAAATRYAQFFDATAVPADGSVPTLIPVAVAAGATLSYSFPGGGRYFRNGFCWCSSSTQGTKTLAGADFWVEVDFVLAGSV